MNKLRLTSTLLLTLALASCDSQDKPNETEGDIVYGLKVDSDGSLIIPLPDSSDASTPIPAPRSFDCGALLLAQDVRDVCGAETKEVIHKYAEKPGIGLCDRRQYPVDIELVHLVPDKEIVSLDVTDKKSAGAALSYFEAFADGEEHTNLSIPGARQAVHGFREAEPVPEDERWLGRNKGHDFLRFVKGRYVLRLESRGGCNLDALAALAERIASRVVEG